MTQLHQRLQGRQLLGIGLKRVGQGLPVVSGHQGTQFGVTAPHASSVGKTAGGQGPHQLSQLRIRGGLISRQQQGGTHQHRQVRNQPHRPVMDDGGAREPAGSDRLSQGPHLFEGFGVRGLGWGRHPGAMKEQRLLTRLHAGFGRSRHRMAPNKAGPAGLPLGQHRSLDRAHIGQHRLRRQGVQKRLGGSNSRSRGRANTTRPHPSSTWGSVAMRSARPRCLGPLGGGLAVHQGVHGGTARPQVQRQGATDQPQAHDPHGPIAPQHCHRRYGPLGPASYDSAMLEARAHHQLKALLRQEGAARWPHHLTLSRLVARSLRREDQTQVLLSTLSDPSWLVGLLVPLALSEAPVALVLSDELRQRLLQQELPRLKGVGLNLPCWEGKALQRLPGSGCSVQPNW